jgi:hypothetical protein
MKAIAGSETRIKVQQRVQAQPTSGPQDVRIYIDEVPKLVLYNVDTNPATLIELETISCEWMLKGYPNAG